MKVSVVRGQNGGHVELHGVDGFLCDLIASTMFVKSGLKSEKSMVLAFGRTT